MDTYGSHIISNGILSTLGGVVKHVDSMCLQQMQSKTAGGVTEPVTFHFSSHIPNAVLLGLLMVIICDREIHKDSQLVIDSSKTSNLEEISINLPLIEYN